MVDKRKEQEMMKLLIANQNEVTQLLPMDESIEVISDALKMMAGGDVLLPLRSMLLLPNSQNLMGVMPSYLGDIQSVGVKVITIFPGNHGTGYDSHQGVVLLFDSQHGQLRAILDGTSITAIRTAAASGVATRLLSREDAGDLALIGAGTQARTHLQAMMSVRKIRRVRVYSLPLGSAHEFAQRESQRHEIEIEVMDSARAAVEGADIICTVTTTKEPVLKGAWISPGAHINAVGAYTPVTRELDSEAVEKARLYVDRKESTLNEAGEFIIPKGEGLIGDDHIVAELGDVLLGKVPGRQSPIETTLFKSLGIAIEDLAAAHLVLQKASQSNVGTWLELGGRQIGSR